MRSSSFCFENKFLPASLKKKLRILYSQMVSDYYYIVYYEPRLYYTDVDVFHFSFFKQKYKPAIPLSKMIAY